MSDDFEIISSDEIEKTPRGRKSTADPALISALQKMGKGDAIRITKYKQDPKSPKYATNKAKVSAQIRSAAKAAGKGKCSIMWSADGIPQAMVE